MADRGRVGSLVVSSRSCAEKVWRKNHVEHAKRLRRVKPVVDISGPRGVEHIHNNLKRERLLEERYQEIDLENKQLLRKMSEIMTRPSSYKDAEVQKINKPTSLNYSGRKKELLEITKENQRLLRSIQAAQPVYSAARWDEDWQRSERLLKNLANYPIVTRMKRNQSAPNFFMPLPPESSAAAAPVSPGSQAQAEESRQVQTPQESSSAAPPADAATEPAELAPAADPRIARLVVKDGKRIGEAYYLVEMTTEGRALHISAYNGETHTSLELVIKEKTHRRLYRECEGDYSALVSKLRIVGNRLVLEGANDPAPTELPPS